MCFHMFYKYITSDGSDFTPWCFMLSIAIQNAPFSLIVPVSHPETPTKALNYPFSKNGASMVAQTEIAKAHEQGSKGAALLQGRNDSRSSALTMQRDLPNSGAGGSEHSCYC